MMLQVAALASRYGRIPALRGIDLHIGKRELVALVGQRDRVEMVASGAVAAATTALGALDFVEEATGGDGRIELVVDQARNHLPSILETAAGNGALVKSVEVVEPDLEAVFLHLTGKALRD